MTHQALPSGTTSADRIARSLARLRGPEIQPADGTLVAEDLRTQGQSLADARATRRLAADPRVRLRPVAFTHDQSVLAAIARFTSINAALEVDLMGQVNAEFVGDRQIAGVGGMADFVRGAAAAPGGRALS
jgi:acyl-CoA hydrolase